MNGITALSRSEVARELRRAAAGGGEITFVLEADTAERLAERFDEVDRWSDHVADRAESMAVANNAMLAATDALETMQQALRDAGARLVRQSFYAMALCASAFALGLIVGGAL